MRFGFIPALFAGLAITLSLSAAAEPQNARRASEIRAEQDAALADPGPMRIGVFGDSLADGLWAGLYRAFRNDDAISEVARKAETSTGLTNYTYVDVAEKTREALRAEDFDIAIVMFGANDIQGIAEDGRVFAFGTAGWEEIYRQRIRELVGLLRADGAAVYWVGLPKMRSARYDRNTIYLNSIYAEEMAALGAPFLETRSATMDAQGEYSAYATDASGAPRLIRADDGIHFTMSGYRRLAAPIADQLRADLSLLAETRLAAAQNRGVGPEAVRYGLVDELLIDVYGEPYICRPAEAATAARLQGAGSGEPSGAP